MCHYVNFISVTGKCRLCCDALLWRSVDVMAASDAGYREVSEDEWRALPAAYSHAAHAMVYAQWPGKFLNKYDYRFAVTV